MRDARVTRGLRNDVETRAPDRFRARLAVYLSLASLSASPNLR